MACLAANERLKNYPRVLLGSFLPFPVYHLHDPYTLDPAYLETCMDRIEAATQRLLVSLNGEPASGQSASDRP
jgi:hypothetical protein